MPKERTYTDEVIFSVLVEAGGRRGALREVLTRHRVPYRTYYHWRRRYGSLDVRTIAALRVFENECSQLKERTLLLERENGLLRHLLGKPWRRLPPGGQPSDTQSEQPE